MATGNIACQTSSTAPIPTHTHPAGQHRSTISFDSNTKRQPYHSPAVGRTDDPSRRLDVNHHQQQQQQHSRPSLPASQPATYSQVTAASSGASTTTPSTKNPTPNSAAPSMVTSPWTLPPWKRHPGASTRNEKDPPSLSVPAVQDQTVLSACQTLDVVPAEVPYVGWGDAPAPDTEIIPGNQNTINFDYDYDAASLCRHGSSQAPTSSDTSDCRSTSDDSGELASTSLQTQQHRRQSWTHSGVNTDMNSTSFGWDTVATGKLTKSHHLEPPANSSRAGRNTSTAHNQRRRSQSLAEQQQQQHQHQQQQQQHYSRPRQQQQQQQQPMYTVDSNDFPPISGSRETLSQPPVESGELEKRLGKISLSADAAPFEPSFSSMTMVPQPLVSAWLSPLDTLGAVGSAANSPLTPPTTQSMVGGHGGFNGHRSEPTVSSHADRNRPRSSRTASSTSLSSRSRRNSPSPGSRSAIYRSYRDGPRGSTATGSFSKMPVHGVSGLLMTPMRMQVDGHSQTDLAFEYHPAYSLPRNGTKGRRQQPRSRDELETDMSPRRNYLPDSSAVGSMHTAEFDDSVILEGQDDASYDATCGWILSETLPTRLSASSTGTAESLK